MVHCINMCVCLGSMQFVCVSVWSCHVKLNFHAAFSVCFYILFADVEAHSLRSPLGMSNASTLSDQISPHFIARLTGILLESLFLLSRMKYLLRFQRRMSTVAHCMLNTNTLHCKAVCLMRAGVKWKCEIHCG